MTAIGVFSLAAKRRTILFVHKSPSALGGSESAALLAATELRSRGHRVLLLHAERSLTATAAAAFDESLSIPVVFQRPTLSAFRQLGRGVRRLRRALVDEQVDLVHAHLWGSWTLLALLRGRTPLVVTAHLPVCPNGARYRFATERPCDRRTGVTCLTWGHRTQGCGHTADERPFGWPAMVVAIIETKAELRALSAAAAVIAPSTWQSERLVADGIRAEKVKVVPEPVVVDVVQPRQATHGELPRVVVACRLVRFKGVHHLIDASASATVPHEVHVIGDGAARPDLERQAMELGIANRVTFHGRMSSEETARHLSGATVVAVPSLWPETFGMSGAEASEMGRRVLAYGHGGAIDWLDSESGDISVAEVDPVAFASGLDAALAVPSRPRHPLHARLDARLPAHGNALERIYEAAVASSSG